MLLAVSSPVSASQARCNIYRPDAAAFISDDINEWNWVTFSVNLSEPVWASKLLVFGSPVPGEPAKEVPRSGFILKSISHQKGQRQKIREVKRLGRLFAEVAEPDLWQRVGFTKHFCSESGSGSLSRPRFPLSWDVAHLRVTRASPAAHSDFPFQRDVRAPPLMRLATVCVYYPPFI